MQEKRQYERHDHYFFINIALNSFDTTGIGINISLKSILFHSLTKLKIGEEATVSIKLEKKSDIVRTGKVIRIEYNKVLYPNIKNDENIYAIIFNALLKDDELYQILNN